MIGGVANSPPAAGPARHHTGGRSTAEAAMLDHGATPGSSIRTDPDFQCISYQASPQRLTPQYSSSTNPCQAIGSTADSPPCDQSSAQGEPCASCLAWFEADFGADVAAELTRRAGSQACSVCTVCRDDAGIIVSAVWRTSSR